MLGNLLNITTVCSALTGVGSLRRFLLTALKVLILGITCVFTLCAVFVSVLYLIYFTLVHNGVDPYIAGMTLSALVFFVTTFLAAVLIYHLKRARELCRVNLLGHAESWPDLGDVTTAFIDGFVNPIKPK